MSKDWYYCGGCGAKMSEEENAAIRQVEALLTKQKLAATKQETARETRYRIIITNGRDKLEATRARTRATPSQPDSTSKTSSHPTRQAKKQGSKSRK